MNRIFEASAEANLRDGGFIFQAILNYDFKWAIIDGETAFNQDEVFGYLTQVDVFPDMQFNSGSATLTYAILSEVNILKRKIDLASEIIKRKLNAEYAAAFLAPEDNQPEKKEEPPITDVSPEPEGNEDQKLLPEPQKRLNEPQKQLNEPQKRLNEPQKQLPEPQKQLPAGSESLGESVQVSHLTAAQIKDLNEKYFKGTRYDIYFTATGIVLREVSTSGIDSGHPTVTLKLSTGMVDTLDGQPINNWNNFKVKAVGSGQSIEINNTGDDPISKMMAYDSVDNTEELIFRTILPSLILEFTGDRTQIDTYSNRSSQVIVGTAINFENLFEPEVSKTEIVTPEEGEEPEEEETVEEPETGAKIKIKTFGEEVKNKDMLNSEES